MSEASQGGGDSAAAVASAVKTILTSTDSERRVRRLLKDNQKQRDEIRDLKVQVKDLEKVKPQEGTVVLTAEEAKQWTAFKELGKPEDVKAKLEKLPELEQKVQAREHADAVTKACEMAGLNATAMLKLPGVSDLKFEVKKEKVDGKDVDVAYVTEAKQGATPKKLTDHVEAAWPEFLPALKADAAPPRTTGTPFPGQAPRGGSPRNGPLGKDEIREQKLQTGRYAGI